MGKERQELSAVNGGKVRKALLTTIAIIIGMSIGVSILMAAMLGLIVLLGQAWGLGLFLGAIGFLVVFGLVYEVQNGSTM